MLLTGKSFHKCRSGTRKKTKQKRKQCEHKVEKCENKVNNVKNNDKHAQIFFLLSCLLYLLFFCFKQLFWLLVSMAGVPDSKPYLSKHVMCSVGVSLAVWANPSVVKVRMGGQKV